MCIKITFAMDTNSEVQCGVCLKFVPSTECQILDGTLMEFFETLLIKLNFDPSTTFCICIDCEEKVNGAFNFKCLCIGTEDTITPYLGSEKIDLKKILCDQEKYENVYYDSDLEVCRLCKNFVSCNAAVSLNQILEDESMKEIFLKHIPEINLEATINPSICQGCQESLINFANLLFLLFDYKDKNEPNAADVKQQILEGKESVLKKVKREHMESSVDHSKIKMERVEYMEYEVKEETEKLEQAELQLKTEETDENQAQDDSNGSYPAVTDDNTVKLVYTTSGVTNLTTPPTYKCSECKYDTKSLAELIEHTRNHTTRKGATTSSTTAPLFYKCKLCGFATRQQYLLKLHMQDHVQVEAKKNKQKSLVTVQKPEVVPSTPEEPKVAPSNPEKPAVVSKKPNVVKIGIKKIHKCPECTFETESSSKFWAHLLIHPNYYFKKVVPSVDEKNNAKRIVFIGRTSGAMPWKKMFKCELCHYIGSSHQDFMNHVLVHVTQSKKKKNLPMEQCVIEETIHYCELCEYRTLCLDELKSHVEVHMQA